MPNVLVVAVADDGQHELHDVQQPPRPSAAAQLNAPARPIP